jgi:hypothetical protein
MMQFTLRLLALFFVSSHLAMQFCPRFKRQKRMWRYYLLAWTPAVFLILAIVAALFEYM